jgi:hypothetical protein
MVYQDLLKDSSAADPSDKDSFLVTVIDLNPDQAYPIQFRWKYSDGSYGQDWSPSYTIYTGAEGTLIPPHFTSINVSGGSGFISVTWDGKDSTGIDDLINFDRVDIHIKDYTGNSVTTFGDGAKATAFFKTPGTKTIVAPAGKYVVKLRTVGLSGKTSAFVPEATNDYLVTVTSGLTIEDPTLPVGLSVSTVPFGIAVNWSGAYNAASFFGFQSINIYASATDYGSTTTSTNITNSKLVGTMSVNDSANKITVGLDALRTALGLSANKDCYTTNTYFYYIATNLNGVKYKVSGAEVYTRISATPIKATQANFIDLANGVISIENLVAGNGSFTSWLRAGTPGGARIELSSTSVIANDAGGYAVVPGLTVYNSGGTPEFQADLNGNVSLGGYTKTTLDQIKTKGDTNAANLIIVSDAAQTASNLAGTKNKVFVEASVPSAVAKGDVWLNTYAGTVSGYIGNNTTYIASAAGTGSWVAATVVEATQALGKIVGFNSNGTLFNKDLQFENGAGSIRSNKLNYEADGDLGWYLGYKTASKQAAIALGSAEKGLMKWDADYGLQLTGPIKSTSTITGGAVYGATLGTSIDTAIKRIHLPASGNSILFKTASTDVDQNGTQLSVDGYVTMDSISSPVAGTTGNYPGIKIQGPSASSYSGLSSLTMVNTPVGGATVIRGYIVDLYGWVRIMGQPDPSLYAVRNITTGSGSPYGGNLGDVYFQI